MTEVAEVSPKVDTTATEKVEKDRKAHNESFRSAVASQSDKPAHPRAAPEKDPHASDSYLHGSKEPDPNHYGFDDRMMSAAASWIENGDSEMSQNPAQRAWRGGVGAARGMVDGMGSALIAIAPHIPTGSAPFAITPSAFENQKAEMALKKEVSDHVNEMKNDSLDSLSNFLGADPETPEYRFGFAGGVISDLALGLGIGKNVLTKTHDMGLNLDKFDDFQISAVLNLKYFANEEKPYHTVFEFINNKTGEKLAQTSVLKTDEFWQVMHDLRDHLPSLGIPDFAEDLQGTGRLAEDIAFVAKNNVKQYSFGANIFGQMQLPYRKRDLCVMG
jgi:hypothetical protein